MPLDQQINILKWNLRFTKMYINSYFGLNEISSIRRMQDERKIMKEQLKVLLIQKERQDKLKKINEY